MTAQLSTWAGAGLRRVLAVRLDNLGDVLVTTPALHAMKESLPAVSLTLLASPIGAQAGALNPDIDDVLVYQAAWMDPWGRLPQDPAREQAVIAAVAAGSFDAAVIFTSYRQSALPAAYLCYLAGVPLRLAASIDGPGSLLTTRHRHPEQMMHEVERGLDLVGAVGLGTAETDLVLRVPPSEQTAIGDTLRHASTAHALVDGVGENSAPDADGPLVVVHPGCSMPARTYPWEMFAAVIDLLVEELGATVAVTGAEDERDLVARVCARVAAPNRARVLPLAGALSFPVLCALVQHADLTVTNNTGPMHIAAAVKTPVVALFALTNPPEQWGPWRVPHRQLYHEVRCRLCYARVCPHAHECLRLVSPAQVLVAARDLLDGSTRDRDTRGGRPL